MRHSTTIIGSRLAPSAALSETALPRVIGHRGAASYAPENTLAAFRQAKALGCRCVEFDVRLTADRQPVLLHDDQLQRTTDGRGRVSTLPLAAVRRHNAGAWFGPAFAAERVPTFEEAVTLIAELGLDANIELKAVWGRRAETARIVADLILRLWPSKLTGWRISSFHPHSLAAAAAHAPGIARGILFRSVPRNWLSIVEKLGCTTVHADHLRLNPAIVADIRAAGYPVLAYTVNDPVRADTLFAWGVTSVFSDDPCVLDKLPARAEPGRRMIPDPQRAETSRGLVS